MKYTLFAAMLATFCAFAITACGEKKANETQHATPAPAAETPATPPAAPTHEATPAAPEAMHTPDATAPAAPAEAPKQ